MINSLIYSVRCFFGLTRRRIQKDIGRRLRREMWERVNRPLPVVVLALVIAKLLGLG